MNYRHFLLSIFTGISIIVSADEARPFQYHPEGREIVCYDGNNRYTRALYGSHTEYRIETSDRPIFGIFRKRAHRNIRFTLDEKGKTFALESTTHCEARYSAGMRRYLLTDEAWGKAQLEMTVLAHPEEETALWCIESHGLSADAKMTCIVGDVLRPRFKRSGDLGSDPADSFDPATTDANRQTISWQVGAGKHFLVLALDSTNRYHLSVATEEEGRLLYEKAMKHQQWLANSIVFDTPDPYLNTMGGALMAAADGAWDGKVWLHGAVVWRMPLNGWRAAYMGDVLGMPDRARSHFSAYAASQITNIEPTIPHPSQDPDKAMARALKKWGTQMYSNGYITRNPNSTSTMHHYDMNLNYIDELLWHFEYDADTAYIRQMWPVLKRHLDWEKRNYDPDNDGLYDAYCCIWASDALYYNSGAVTHSSAYNYRGFRLAARIAELLGEDPTYYRQEAEKTLAAMNSRLWLKDKGHWAEYQDLMGLKRTHDHAALWSIYTPIDCGAATAAQAMQATQYVDSCIPHINLNIAGARQPELATISTTDWLPYEWSINNVAAEEVMHTALAYFQAGRNEDGYRLLKANILDFAYLGSSPGNFGQISYYDKARGELYRDFSDNTGISSRALIQGLFGIIPQALDGYCILRPGFPEEWDHAAITTPYFKYTFRREGDKEIYEVEQHFAQPLTIRLRQNTGDGTYIETIGSAEEKQTFVVQRAPRRTPNVPFARREHIDGSVWGNNFNDVQPKRTSVVNIDKWLNSDVSDIFKNEYLSPRSPYTTLQIPVHGLGDWCHPDAKAVIDDSALRQQVKSDLLTVDHLGIPFRSHAEGRNIAYTSLWDNYPDAISIPLKGKASHAYLLMAGSTNHMQSRIDNGLVIVDYTDGTADTLHLQNPHNWCPIEQDYYEDGLAFHAAQPRPYRIDFATAKVTRELMPMGKHYGKAVASGVAGSYNDRKLEKGAGIILDMPLNPRKKLKQLTLRTLSNDVVIGLMGITLQR